MVDQANVSLGGIEGELRALYEWLREPDAPNFGPDRVEAWIARRPRHVPLKAIDVITRLKADALVAHETKVDAMNVAAIHARGQAQDEVDDANARAERLAQEVARLKPASAGPTCPES